MNLMDRLAATLDDADELLADVDAQTIDECLARGEAPDHRDDDEACPWCHHGFHGLGCYPPVAYLVTNSWYFDPDPVDDAALPLTDVGGGLDWPCRCDSALDRLDDTWRPPVAPWGLASLMHQTGLDGWSAQALFNRSLNRVQKAAEDAERWVSIGSTDRSPVIETECPECAAGGSHELPVAPAVIGRSISVSALISGSVTYFMAPMDVEPVPVVPFDPEPVVEPAEETPARALRHRQTRNTGPARPTAGRAHRPRRHT